jgi:hypothetical protein
MPNTYNPPYPLLGLCWEFSAKREKALTWADMLAETLA